MLRMGNERLTKAMVLGWYEVLEGRSKMIEKKKTVLYWKRMLREAGVDVTDVERLVGDRKGWKKRVEGRMDYLYRRECQKGMKYEWEESEESMERNSKVVERLVCRYDGCGKVCRSKAGLTMHEKKMHRVPNERVRFACSICGMNVETEGVRKNHERSCMGGEIGRDGRHECGRCGA